MRRHVPKHKDQRTTAKNRKSGRTVFDKSGHGIWEWQTATGVFEKQISDEQLARLEDSQLTLLDSPPSRPVSSYYEWCESSKMTAESPKSPKSPKPDAHDSPRGTFVRLFKRLANRT